MIRSISEKHEGLGKAREVGKTLPGALKELGLCRKAGHPQSRAGTEQAEERQVGGHTGPEGAQGHSDPSNTH